MLFKNRKFLFLIMVLCLLSAIVSSNREGKAKIDYRNLESKIYSIESFSNINNDGSFVLSSEDGKNFIIKKEFTAEESIKHYDYYFDVFCKDCINLHEAIGKDFYEMILNKELELRLHPLNFLSKKQNNEYSLIGSSYILSLAENNQPNLLVEFMEVVLTNDFKEENKDSINIQSVYKNKILKLSKNDNSIV